MVEVRGQRVQPRRQHDLIGRAAPHERRLPGQRERRQAEQRQRLAAQPGRPRAPHQPRPQRQERVEGDLHAQRPGLHEPAGERVGRVDLAEAVVGDDPAQREHARQREGDRRDGQCEPVRGHDPQRPPARVAPDARQLAIVEPREQERAVEHEARDHEEDRDADLEPLRDATGVTARGRQAGVDRGVREQHGDRGQRPQAVDRRVATVGSGHRIRDTASRCRGDSRSGSPA